MSLLLAVLLAGCGQGHGTLDASTTPDRPRPATPLPPGKTAPSDPRPTRVTIRIEGGRVLSCGAEGRRCPLAWTPETFAAPVGACTQIYGGPERARASGVVDGTRVDAALGRSNGCLISQWTAIVGALDGGAP